MHRHVPSRRESGEEKMTRLWTLTCPHHGRGRLLLLPCLLRSDGSESTNGSSNSLSRRPPPLRRTQSTTITACCGPWAQNGDGAATLCVLHSRHQTSSPAGTLRHKWVGGLAVEVDIVLPSPAVCCVKEEVEGEIAREEM
jgi:hypothetical protein